jgi:hypothetical protein
MVLNVMKKCEVSQNFKLFLTRGLRQQVSSKSYLPTSRLSTIVSEEQMSVYDAVKICYMLTISYHNDGDKENLVRITHRVIWYICTDTWKNRGQDSSVGIATGYGLDGLGIESRWWRDFSHTSRPALGSTQPPV